MSLFGCSHKKMTHVFTPRREKGMPEQVSYVTCLECGKRFAYDLSAMRMKEEIKPDKPRTWQETLA